MHDVKAISHREMLNIFLKHCTALFAKSIYEKCPVLLFPFLERKVVDSLAHILSPGAWGKPVMISSVL
jgi:hypothetical protein